MPYRARRYNNRSRSGKPRMPYLRYKQTQQVARRTVQNALRKNIEIKYFNARNGTSDNIDWEGLVYAIYYNPSGANTIVQGVNENQYVGKCIHTKHLTINYQFVFSDVTNIVSIVVFQSIGSFSPLGGTMENVFQSTTNALAPLSFPDQVYNQRFRILARRIHHLDNNNMLNVTGTIRLHSNKMRPTYFSDNAGTYENGGLYLGVISDSSDGGPQFTYQLRAYFTDA